ncbi:tetraspanin-2-like [Salarias fasciatus]|uniref:Tetraspanin n=1 Tax=Salarias fasciatus TaxID=181472 RepID=A0A672JJZ1_SALFA|nr:tetraspanin-2-like [Salarias fasciatus]
MGKVQGGMKCVKYLLFFFNFIFWLSGLLVLAVGLWLRFDPETVKLLTGDEAPSTFFIAVYILLGAGGLMMIVGFFGCFGAVQESQCLLASFFACLLIIFGAEITAGVFGFINKEKISEEVQKFYSSSIVEVNNSNGTADIYHQILNCCGGSSPETNAALCEDAEEAPQNCLDAISDFFDQKLHIIGFVGIGIAGVMIIGMVFSMVLCCAIRNSREVI